MESDRAPRTGSVDRSSINVGKDAFAKSARRSRVIALMRPLAATSQAHANQRAMYSVIAIKRSRTEYTVVPMFDGNLSMHWYPIEGVQLKLGWVTWEFIVI